VALTGEETRRQPHAVTRRHRGWVLWVIGTVLAGALLMFCYLRVAGATQVNSDGAGQVLQASDMLHGNLLLHGWWDTDVSFITTELPEYMAVTAVAGIRPEVVHICAALTYTLLVLLAAFVARGRARGTEGVVRALIAAGVMLAPQPTGPTVVLLGSPDHVGTAVPLLLLLLVLDRAPPRWYVPVCVAVLLAWTIVGDALAEVVGVVPLVLACLLRAGRIIAARRAAPGAGAAGIPAGRGPATRDEATDEARGEAGAAARAQQVISAGRAVWYELSLAVAAVAAVPAAKAANSLIRSAGGYHLGPAAYHPLPLHQVARTVPMVWQSVLALFGADYAGVTGAGNVAFALLHLAGVAAVIGAFVFAAWRLIRPPRGDRLGDLVADVLVLAIAVNVAAYLFFVPYENIYSAHEIGPVLSLGAALAGRMLGGPLLKVRLAPARSRSPARFRSRLPWFASVRGPARHRQRRGTPVLVPVLAAVLACYAVLLGIAAASPQRTPQNVHLATWLRQHHLYSGLAPYWQSASVTVASGGKITMLAVESHGKNSRLAPDAWETDGQLADPATHTANFVVIVPGQPVPRKVAVEMFGKPAKTYHFESYTILVWKKNLLSKLGPPV